MPLAQASGGVVKHDLNQGVLPTSIVFSSSFIAFVVPIDVLASVPVWDESGWTAKSPSFTVDGIN